MSRTKAFSYDEILEEAMNLFWQKGYHATSMDDLVNHLKINRSSLYNSYGNKKDIFFKGIENYQKRNIERIKKTFETEPTTKSAFIKIIESTIDFLSSDKSKRGCLIINSTTELIPEDKEVESFLQKNKNTLEKLFSNQIKKAVQTGELKNLNNPESLAQLIYTIHSGIGVLCKFQNKVEYKKNIINQINQIFSSYSENF